MTTILPIEETCAICGAATSFYVLGSTNTMGPPDLDMRPAPMARWTLAEQIQRCPECGYCAKDISVACDAARQVVHNEAYQAELSRADYPELTRRYLCASLILSVAGDEAGAGRAALMGAWAADDIAGVKPAEAYGLENVGMPEAAESRPAGEAEREAAEREAAAEAAAHCRRLAIGYFEADRKRLMTFAADDDTADALLADLYRRVGDFEAARGFAQAGSNRGAPRFALEVFRFQLFLIDLGDTTCHNTGEIGADEDFEIILG